jgi:hypothetical protein
MIAATHYHGLFVSCLSVPAMLLPAGCRPSQSQPPMTRPRAGPAAGPPWKL